jgi:nitric oxide reductase NorD protein
MSLSFFSGDLRRLDQADQQRLAAVLDELLPPSRESLLCCLQAAAAFDERPLPGVISLLGPVLRRLPFASRASVLERVAQLSYSFPAGVVPLLRSLGQVYDEAGEERTHAWIAAGEHVARRNPEAGIAFFTLTSRTSLLTLRGASPAVYLSDIQGVLLKYLHMLSGSAIGLSETETLSFPPPLAGGEGELIFLPACIEQFPTYEENFRLYRVLVAHQVGRGEFETYTCSPSRLWPVLRPFLRALTGREVDPPVDLSSYFHLFPQPELIEALFLRIEGKRIAARLGAMYPGLQPDLGWAETLTDFLPVEISAVLSHLSDSAWSQLNRTGTVSDSLLWASQLYTRFFSHAPRSAAVISSPLQPEDVATQAGDAMAFLTGVDLEEDKGGKALSAEKQAARRRRTLTTTNLHYLYDEWDYEIEDYRPHWCELREVPLQGDGGKFFARTLTTYADLIPDIKREFQRLRPRMYRQVKGLEDGEEIDLNAVVNARVDRQLGHSPSTKLYMARELTERDVAVLFLLDLSASTAQRLLPADGTSQPPVNGQRDLRVIEVLKEALVLLSIALEEIGDAYAIYGFSSNGRHDVEVYPVKTFSESLAAEVQGRIGGLTPRGSTRMGTAVRHATRRLKEVTSRAKLLVLLSDGYPEDAGYGKPVIPPMYGLRDTLMALREAERSGIRSFCLTVDKEGRDYLGEMCPASRYLVIEDLPSLPTELPKIYQRHIWAQWG